MKIEWKYNKKLDIETLGKKKDLIYAQVFKSFNGQYYATIFINGLMVEDKFVKDISSGKEKINEFLLKLKEKL